jgi:hypothetical protein
MSVRRGVIVVFVLLGLAVMMSLGGLLMLSLMAGAPPSVPQNAALYLPLRPRSARSKPRTSSVS